MNRTLTRSLALVATAVLVVAACGDDGDDDGAESDGTTAGTARRRRPVGVPRPARDPDRLVPRGGARRALRDGRRGLLRRHRQAGRARPARQRWGGDGHRHRDPHRRPGDRRPAGVGAAVCRRQHHARLRQHRGADPALRRDAGAVRRRPAGDQPADHLLGSRDVPRGRDPRRPRRGGRDDQHLPRRRRSPRCSSPRASGTPTRSTRPTTAARPASSPRTGRSPSRASPRPSRTRTRTFRSGASRSPSRRCTTPGSRSTRRCCPSCPTRSRSCARASRRSCPWSSRRPSTTSGRRTGPTPSSSTPSRSTTRFWIYPEGLAEYSVTTQRELGYVGNGPDDTLGNMDEDRVQGVLDQIRDAGLDVPEDLTVADLVTNEFVDPSIGLLNRRGGHRRDDGHEAPAPDDDRGDPRPVRPPRRRPRPQPPMEHRGDGRGTGGRIAR